MTLMVGIRLPDGEPLACKGSTPGRMAMAIRILDCAPMSPWFPRWQVGGTCLLVETDQGLVLADTGVCVHAHESPSCPVRFFRMVLGPHGPRLKAFAQANPEVFLLAGHMRPSFFESLPAG